MRKVWSFLVSLALVAGTVLPARAGTYPDCPWDPTDPGVCAEEPKQDISGWTRIVVNGQDCHVAKVVLYRDRTYVPLRAFSQCMGMTVNWMPRGQDNIDSLAVITGAPSTLGQMFDAYFQPVAESPTVRVVYADHSEHRFHLDGKPYLDPETNLTMIPFRFVTDLANAQTSWSSLTLNRPWNEIQVDLQTVALPMDQWLVASKYVGYTELGFVLLDPGTQGYEIYPSTLRHLSYALELYNLILEEKGANGVEMDVSGFRVRTEDAYGPVDYLGAVTIRWLQDEETAQQYLNRIEREQRLVKGGASVVTAGLSLFFGATGQAVRFALSFSAFGVSMFSFFSDDWGATFKACRDRAGLKKYKDKQPEDAPALWGFADTPNGTVCVPYYSESPLLIMVKP